jgi:cation diffusion facilitator family transporter
MLIAAVPLVILLRQRARGPAARAQLLESVNDELGLLAALLGTLFILWGKPIADPIASIIVASIIAYNGIRLFLENLDFLLGRSPEPQVMERMRALAQSVPGVVSVREIRAEYVGPEVIHAGMQVEVSADLTVQEAERIRAEIDRRVHANLQPGYCVIQMSPAPVPGAPQEGQSRGPAPPAH